MKIYILFRHYAYEGDDIVCIWNYKPTKDDVRKVLSKDEYNVIKHKIKDVLEGKLSRIEDGFFVDEYEMIERK